MSVEYRSASRGYQICVEEDLFGCFILYRRWFGLRRSRFFGQLAKLMLTG